MSKFLEEIKKKAKIIGDKTSVLVPSSITKEGREFKKSYKKAIIGQAKVDRTKMLQNAGMGGYTKNKDTDKILKKLNSM